MNLSEWVWSSLGLLLTIMVLSYLIGDNVFFRFAAHLFVGTTAGYLSVLIIKQIILPYLVLPLINGTWMGRLWLVVPLVLIVFLLLSQIPRFTAFGSAPLAFLVGLTAAIVIGGAVFGTLIPQSQAVVAAFDQTKWFAQPANTWHQITDAVIMLIGTVGTLSYFHFGRKRKPKDEREAAQRPRVLEIFSKVGQVFIGITLGAVFAGVFSSSLFALIDRIWFITHWFSTLLGGR